MIWVFKCVCALTLVITICVCRTTDGHCRILSLWKSLHLPEGQERGVCAQHSESTKYGVMIAAFHAENRTSKACGQSSHISVWPTLLFALEKKQNRPFVLHTITKSYAQKTHFCNLFEVQRCYQFSSRRSTSLIFFYRFRRHYKLWPQRSFSLCKTCLWNPLCNQPIPLNKCQKTHNLNCVIIVTLTCNIW